MIKSPLNTFLKNQPKSNHSNYFNHQNEENTYKRYQHNPVFHLPKQYYKSKQKFQQSLSAKYYSHNLVSENIILKQNQHNNNIIQSYRPLCIKRNHCNQNLKAKENIQQLRSSLDSLEKMFEKSESILRSPPKKLLISNIEQNLSNNKSINKLHSKIKSDLVNLKLRTQGSIGSSIQSRNSKNNKSKINNINLKNHLSTCKREVIIQKNNYKNLYIKENKKVVNNSKKRIIFNPQTSNSKLCGNKNNSSRKEKNICLFQKTQKGKKQDIQYQFYFNSLQNQKQDEKFRTLSKNQSFHLQKSHSQRKNLINITIDITPQQIDFNNDKILIQDGKYSPINNKIKSPTTFSNFSGWNTQFKSDQNNDSINDQQKLSSPFYEQNIKNQHFRTKNDQENQIKKIKMEKTKKQKQINYQYKIQKQKNQKQNYEQRQSREKIYFTGKNLPQYYFSNTNKHKNEYQKIILRSPQGKKSVFNQKNNLKNEKTHRSNRMKSYLNNNYFVDLYEKSSKSKNNSLDQKSYSCKKNYQQSQNLKKKQFVKKVQKYAFVQKYLTQKQIISIYEDLKKTSVPQNKWVLQVIDQVYKKMENMNKSIQQKY